MGFSEHPRAIHGKIPKFAIFELRYFGRLCSNFAPKDTIWTMFFSSFTLIQYLRSVVSPLNKNLVCVCFTFASRQPYMSPHPSFFPSGYYHFFLREFWNLRGKFFSFSLYIAMSENYTWREELKANFQLNTPECLLFATAILFFIKLPLLNPRAQMSRISGDEHDLL